MINQFEVPSIIADELPELKPELRYLPSLGSIFKAMQMLVDYTNKMFSLGKIKNVKKCMEVTEKIYEKGNMVIKNAVENVYIFSFSKILMGCDREERKSLEALMPLSLHTLYVQQILKSGI